MWTVLLIAFQLCFIDVNAQIDFSTLLALVGAQRSATGGVPVFGTDPRLRHDPLSYYRRNGRPAVADGVSLSNVNKVVHNTKYRTKERFQIWDLGQESAQLRSLDYKITTTTTLEPEVARAAPAPPPGSYGTSPYMGSWYPPPFPPYPPYGYPPYNPYLINPYANPNYGRRRGPRPKRPPTEESKVGEEKEGDSEEDEDDERPKRISKCKKKYKKCKRRKSSDEESDSEENDDKEEEQEADNEEDDDGDSDGSEDEKDKKVDENEQTEGKMERTQNGG
ncbi:hypothetical protein Q1695_011382 [Nippostrongylus brasiliensis]|nr:hypothetical protein Q1695_011382 [Nippostrongylus brasiliensis]